jgi:hypothetical protein
VDQQHVEAKAGEDSSRDVNGAKVYQEWSLPLPSQRSGF